jgi:hypothetical protein
MLALTIRPSRSSRWVPSSSARHADAADHAADRLAVRELRVDDAAGVVAAVDAPDPHSAEQFVDRDLGEHGAVCRHREPVVGIVRRPALFGVEELPSLAAQHVLVGFAAARIGRTGHAPVDDRDVPRPQAGQRGRRVDDGGADEPVPQHVRDGVHRRADAGHGP